VILDLPTPLSFAGFLGGLAEKKGKGIPPFNRFCFGGNDRFPT